MTLRDLVIIDPWPEPAITDLYQQMAAWASTQRDVRQIVLASYESGSIDPAFYSLMIQDPRVCLYHPRQPLSSEVWIMGQEWWRCMHSRPLGIHALASQGHDILIKPQWCLRRRHTETHWQSVSDTQLDNDAYVWHRQQDHWRMQHSPAHQQLADQHLRQQLYTDVD